MRVIIVGAGGFGREVLQYVIDIGVDDVIGFLDDSPTAIEEGAPLPPWLGATDCHSIDPDARYVIGVGRPSIRAALATRLERAGAQFLTVVHPRAYVPTSVRIAPGCIVAPGAHIGPYATLGPHAVLNVLASVGHDAVVGRAAVLSPYAVVNGGAVIGDDVLLGTHSSVLVGVQVGEGSQIAAGAVVYRDVAPYSLAQGDPAKSRVMYARPEAAAPDAS